MFAYVFWHWKQAEISAADYELRQRDFHAALTYERPIGFIKSFSNSVVQVPWVKDSRNIYEDWYLVKDFSALGILNLAAVSSSRSKPHDLAAAVAAGGSGGLYGLKLGSPLRNPKFAHWFGKPVGMPYGEFFSKFSTIINDMDVALWMRQMVLGPAREFCLHSMVPVPLPIVDDVLVVPLREVYSE